MKKLKNLSKILLVLSAVSLVSCNPPDSSTPISSSSDTTSSPSDVSTTTPESSSSDNSSSEPDTTSSEPGPDTTSSEPGPDTTSSEPGPDTTSSEPGPDSTSSEPGPDSTSSEPGPDSSSSEPDPDTSSSEPDPDSSSSEPGPDSSSSEPDPDTSSSEPDPDSSSSEPDPESSSSESSSSSTEPEPVKYAITVGDVGTDVEVTVVSEAAEGEIVEVELNYLASAVEIISVTAGDDVCGKISDTLYYFEMPANAVEVNVEYDVLSEYHSIINQSSGSILISGIDTASEFKAGSIVSFKAYARPGYNFYGDIRVYTGFGGFTETDIDVSVTDEADGSYSYSFIMPSEDVYILASVDRTTYRLTVDDYVSSVRELKIGETYDENAADGYVEFGATVTITVVSNNNYVSVVQLVDTVTNTTYDVDENHRVTFTMPAHDVVLTSVTTPILRGITAVDSDHITVSAYTLDEDGEYVEATSAQADTTIYVKVESTDPDYAVNTLNVTYQYYYNSSSYSPSNGSINLLESYDADTGYYSFEMPVAINEGVTITVTEKNMNLWAGYGFIGSYLGRNVYSSNATSTAALGSNNLAMTLDGSGVGSLKGNSFTITSADETEGHGVITASSSGSSTYTFAYSPKVFFTSWGMTSLTGSDNIFAVKKQDAADDNAIYTMDYEILPIESIAVVQYFRNGELYASAMTDPSGEYVESNYLLDVSINFKEGTTHITDTYAAYDIVDNVTGNTVLSVGTDASTSGGRTNRVIIDAVAGTYTGESGDLVLDGAGKATLNGESYTYTYEGTTVTLRQGGTTIIIEINTEDGTYTVTETRLPANAFQGYSFVGTFDDGDPYWGYTYGLEVSFTSETEGTIRVYSGTYNYINATHTYTIDEETGVISISFLPWSSSTTPTVLTLTPNTDNTSLTVNEDINNGYPCSGTVLTRQ